MTDEQPAPACDDDEQVPPHDPTLFRAVIEQAQALTVLGEIDADAGRHSMPTPDAAVLRQEIDALHDVVGVVPTWSTPPSHAAPADAALITYAAACRTCMPDGRQTARGEYPRNVGPVQAGRAAPDIAGAGLAIPFASQHDRDQWAAGHARFRGHTVTLIEQHPSTGSTITGHAEPDTAEQLVAPARAPAPLVAFVVREGGPPDMLVRIPPRAAAAWLLTAAHAALLGKGSIGIDQPHRALYVGRLTRDDEFWLIRIDGLLGATSDLYGDAIGMVCRVDGTLTPAQAEDVVEALVARSTGLTRNLFSVVIMADAEPADPPDPDADHALRAERLDGCVPELPGG